MTHHDTDNSARRWRWMALLALQVTVLQGCNSSGSAPAEPPPPPPAATLQGRLANAADGSAIAGATVSGGGRSATSGADGRWRIEGLTPADRQVLRVRAAGFADGLLALPAPAGEGGSGEWPLLAAGNAVAIDPTQPATVEDTATGARLVAPANAFVRAEGGAAPSGSLSVRLTSVDPALDPARMPGDYSTESAGTVRVLESFGAVQVDVRDAAGNRYTLASGRSATLRIPASSRGNLPDTVGLYSLDETTGRWVDEGTAQLAGSGSRRWYEATVTHLSWWNADLPLETVFANGCLRGVAGSPAAARTLRSVGIDYTGSATARSDAAGNFRVAFKKGGRASLVVDAPAGGGAGPQPVALGPSETDITLPSCLQDRSSPTAAPTIVSQPQSQAATAGMLASFSVIADGLPAPRYQWQRNGVDIAGATGPVLNLLAMPLDHAASFRVRISNAAGVVTSAEASLTVIGGGIPAGVSSSPADVRATAGSGASFGVVASGSAPLAYQWQRNGTDLAGETDSALNLPSVSAADDGARFRVRISNPWGSAISNEAMLTVTGIGTPPVITSGGPQDTTASVGQQIRWPTQVNGTLPLSYEWRRNGVPINGATGNTLTFVVQAADNGAEYTLTVRNSLGSVTSAPGRLTVPAAPPTGTLTVGGDALRFVDATFTPNQPQNGALVSVQATGPLCPGTTCVSQWGLTASDNRVSGGVGTNEILMVFVSSLRPAPGVQPGLQPTTVTVLYALTRAQVGVPPDGGSYTLSCGQGAPACTDPAAVGVTVDPVARTVTFNNTRLADGTGAVTTLNGTLGY